ncbi:hypothetical protein MHBO_004654 [Bonamia ostreae]|uniref:Uncharacterized protein n=1 Tax=Bonamia ostreae TaxID=126728 RepID=A0ABV2ATW7_9EUKA
MSKLDKKSLSISPVKYFPKRKSGTPLRSLNKRLRDSENIDSSPLSKTPSLADFGLGEYAKKDSFKDSDSVISTTRSVDSNVSSNKAILLESKTDSLEKEN